MKTEKLFRETAFGGYRREDVLEYLKQIDQEHRLRTEELQSQLTEAGTKAAEYEKRNTLLTAELAEKSKAADAAEESKARADKLEAEAAELRERCASLEKEAEKYKTGFSCERLNGDICPAVTERSAKILADAEEQAKKKLRDADEQATGILTNARVEAQAMITEAEGNTESIARQISDQAHEIIQMTVSEAKGILDTAKQRGTGILASSAQSIGKIKGNLSSMQMVVKNIENELKAAKDSITESLPKNED